MGCPSLKILVAVSSSGEIKSRRAGPRLCMDSKLSSISNRRATAGRIRSNTQAGSSAITERMRPRSASSSSRREMASERMITRRRRGGCPASATAWMSLPDGERGESPASPEPCGGVDEELPRFPRRLRLRCRRSDWPGWPAPSPGGGVVAIGTEVRVAWRIGDTGVEEAVRTGRQTSFVRGVGAGAACRAWQS